MLAAYDHIEAIQANRYQVWKAVEWIDSGDCSPGDEVESLAKWRQSGKMPPPQRVDVAKRLHELEREARALRLKCNGAYVTELDSILADAEKRA